MSNLPPVGPLAYEGAINTPNIVETFNPKTSFNQFPVPTIWINKISAEAWILVQKPLGIADWIMFGGGSGTVIQIDTPDGAMVMPTAGVINFLNGTGVAITGNALTSSITFNSTGLLNIHTPDGNTVTPSAGVINFLNGTDMNITGSGNNITFNSLGGGFQWNLVVAATQALAAGNGYVADRGTQIAFSLPATAAFGDSYAIVGYAAGGWTISQGAGQSVIVGAATSTSGVGGSITSTLSTNTIVLMCIIANTVFEARDWTGNLNVI